MWRIRSSILSSTSSSNNNVDPPATNRRDPDEEHAGLHESPVVMDRPLFYSNVESEPDDNEGLMVVPPAVDEDDDEKVEDLSVNPNQLKDSPFNDDKVEPEGNQFPPSYSTVEAMSFLDKENDNDDKEDEDEDEEEVVLVDEMTEEEQDFLASLDIEPVMSRPSTTLMDDETPAVVTADNENEVEPTHPLLEEDDELTIKHDEDDASEIAANISPQEEHELERMVEEAELLAAQMKAAIELSPTVTLSKQEGNDLERMVQEAEDFAAQIKGENKDSSDHEEGRKDDDFAKVVMPVWRYYTVALSVAALLLLACTGTEQKDVHNIPFSPSSVDVLHDLVSVDLLPQPAPTPNLPLAPIAVPLFGSNHSLTTLQNVTDLQEELDDENSSPTEETELKASWLAGHHEFLYAGSLLLFYYMFCFWIRKGSFPSTESQKEEGCYIQNDGLFLNSFQGMMAFHKNFKKSGKGRRVANRSMSKSGKFDASSYGKLTRQELLKILDGFERYVGRDAAKSRLIHDLCNVYEDALYRFSNPQILLLLQAKGYSVNTNMSKQELVALAVKIGF